MEVGWEVGWQGMILRLKKKRKPENRCKRAQHVQETFGRWKFWVKAESDLRLFVFPFRFIKSGENGTNYRDVSKEMEHSRAEGYTKRLG